MNIMTLQKVKILGRALYEMCIICIIYYLKIQLLCYLQSFLWHVNFCFPLFMLINYEIFQLFLALNKFLIYFKRRETKKFKCQNSVRHENFQLV